MIDVKSAIMGTPDPRALLLEAGVAGMQRKAGYVADAMPDVEIVSFLHTNSGRVAFNSRDCVVHRLSPEFWIEVVFPVDDDMKLRYPNVLVFNDFVVFCWSDAMEISYEWCQLEVTRECLIELWESDAP